MLRLPLAFVLALGQFAVEGAFCLSRTGFHLLLHLHLIWLAGQRAVGQVRPQVSADEGLGRIGALRATQCRFQRINTGRKMGQQRVIAEATSQTTTKATTFAQLAAVAGLVEAFVKADRLVSRWFFGFFRQLVSKLVGDLVRKFVDEILFLNVLMLLDLFLLDFLVIR